MWNFIFYEVEIYIYINIYDINKTNIYDIIWP